MVISGPQDEDLAFGFVTVGRNYGGRGERGQETGQEEETKQKKKREILALKKPAQ